MPEIQQRRAGATSFYELFIAGVNDSTLMPPNFGTALTTVLLLTTGLAALAPGATALHDDCAHLHGTDVHVHSNCAHAVTDPTFEWLNKICEAVLHRKCMQD